MDCHVDEREVFLSLRKEERLTSRGRVIAAFSHREPDRVPVNYFANAGLDARLKKRLGLSEDDSEGLRCVLGVDFRGVDAPYAGSPLHRPLPGRPEIKVDPVWGIRRVWIEHQSGGYWDYCDFPLKNAGEREIADWPMPAPDDFDYGPAERVREGSSEYALFVGSPGLGCVMNTAGFFRGMEEVFVDLASDNPAGLLLADRFLEIQYEKTRRLLEKAGGRIDFMWMGEDLGTQRGPLISEAVFFKHILPRHRKFIRLAGEYGIPVMLHSCGSSSWAFEAYIAEGLSGVDTLQPEAEGMEPSYLKNKFGGRLFFHGCISTAGPVASGDAFQAGNHVRHILDIMKPGGGYCLAPTHSLQDNSAVDNVLAMYRTAHECGRYGA